MEKSAFADVGEQDRVAHIRGLLTVLKDLNRFPFRPRRAVPPQELALPEDLDDWSPSRQEEFVHQLRGRIADARQSGWAYLADLVRETMTPSNCDTRVNDVPDGLNLFDVRRLTPFPEARPIFVVGAARSGTTAMGSALASAPKLFGWLEGHVFSNLRLRLDSTMQSWNNLRAIPGLPPETVGFCHLNVYDVLNATTAIFNNLYVEAAAQHGAERWVDKTPNPLMLLSVPLICHLYPQAKFIFMHRDPIRRALSRMSRPMQAKSPMAVEMAIFEWVYTMFLWGELRKYLPPECYREVAQQTLNCATQAQALCSFLQLTPDQAQRVYQFLSTARPHSTGSSRDDAEIRLANVQWPDLVKSWVRDFVTPVAREWGWEHLLS